MDCFEDRARPLKQEENTRGQDIHEDPINFFQDRALPIKQEENTQPQEVHMPLDDISPE